MRLDVQFCPSSSSKVRALRQAWHAAIIAPKLTSVVVTQWKTLIKQVQPSVYETKHARASVPRFFNIYSIYLWIYIYIYIYYYVYSIKIYILRNMINELISVPSLVGDPHFQHNISLAATSGDSCHPTQKVVFFKPNWPWASLSLGFSLPLLTVPRH